MWGDLIMNYKILITFILSVFVILCVLFLTMPVWADCIIRIIRRRRNKEIPEGVREAQERAALSGDPHAIKRNSQDSPDKFDIYIRFYGFAIAIGVLMLLLSVPLYYEIYCRILSLLGMI